MSEPSRRVHRSPETWRELFSRQAGSGQSVAEFCQQEGINPSVYRRWQRDLEGSAAARRPLRKKTVGAAQPFIDLGALGEKSARCEVRLELGGGVVLNLVRG
jgi:transposase-like protein